MPRFMKKNTVEDLKTSLDNFVKKNEEVVDDIAGALLSLEECIGGSKLLKDLSKYDFSYNYENVLLAEDTKKTPEDTRSYFYDDFPLMGYQTIEDRTFFGVIAGSDYGLPLYFIVYQDDKNTLRGYIPSKGNSINPYSHCAFGENEDLDQKFAEDQGFASLWEMDSACYKLLDEKLIMQDICKRLLVK